MSDEVERQPETKGRVYLNVVRVDDDPQVVTELIGAIPTRACAKGTPVHPGSDLLEKYTHCYFESSLPETAEIEEQLAELLPRLESLAAGIARAQERFQCRLVIYQSTSSYNTEFELSADQIKRIAALGLPIWVDSYRWPDDD